MNKKLILVTYLFLLFASACFIKGETGSLEDRVYTLDEVSVAPAAIKQPSPTYPPKALRKGLTGTAIVWFVVSKSGKKPKQITVQEASDEIFADAAKEAVAEWEFKSAEIDGEPVRCLVQVEIPFDPKSNPSEQLYKLERLDIRKVKVYTIKEVSVKPEPIKRQTPAYPPSAYREGMEGVVVASFVINTEGKPERIKIHSAPGAEFAQNTLRAIARWEFKPAEVDGEPVSCGVKIPIPFRIR